MGSEGQRDRAKGLLEPKSLALLDLIPPIIQQRKTEQAAGFISITNLTWKVDLCRLLCHQSLSKASLSLDILSLENFREETGFCHEGCESFTSLGVCCPCFSNISFGCVISILAKFQHFTF